jgi:hypothetical protein
MMLLLLLLLLLATRLWTALATAKPEEAEDDDQTRPALPSADTKAATMALTCCRYPAALGRSIAIKRRDIAIEWFFVISLIGWE